jgi:hypothetical protein
MRPQTGPAISQDHPGGRWLRLPISRAAVQSLINPSNRPTKGREPA